MRLCCLAAYVSLICGCAWYSGSEKQAFSIRPIKYTTHGNAGSEALYRLGRYYQHKADYPKAVEAYHNVLTGHPTHVEARNAIAVSYSLQGQHELALRHFRRALEISPKAAYLHNNLGYVYMTLGYHSDAAAAFEQALRLDPENRWARENVVALYGKMGLNDDSGTLTSAGSNATAALIGVSVTAPAQEAGASSAWPSTTIIAPTGGKQGIGRAANTRLVEVAPNLFEIQVIEEGRDGGDTLRGNERRDLSAPKIAVADRRNVRIEISNGSGIRGMARQVSEFLRENGLAHARLTDRPLFHQLETEIHYRPGHYPLAEEVRQTMPNRPPMKESFNLRKDINVRILLGKDASRGATHYKPGEVQVAQNFKSGAVPPTGNILEELAGEAGE